jgi:short subunit dehydrogenase-like uncharacterized protein
MEPLLIYGSNGYTGRLIVEACRKQNIDVILSGRDARKLEEQRRTTGYTCQVCTLDDYHTLHRLLSRVKVVIHCAGPFRHTSETMVKACLETGVHYTDITGEYEVFEKLATYDAAARQRGVMVMPGTGFDVVPTDCLAVHLKNKLPDATHLQLAFTALQGGLSRGTRKSMIEGLGYPGKIRREGRLVNLPVGDKVMEVNFGPFTRTTLCIPWGDIVTAWHSTGIPNIEVYAGASARAIAWIKRTRFLNPLLRNRVVKGYLLRKADSMIGPAPEKIMEGSSYLWGRVWNAQGQQAEARLHTPNGYLLTAKTSVLIARYILQQQFTPGFQTPAMAYGADLILKVEGTHLLD